MTLLTANNGTSQSSVEKLPSLLAALQEVNESSQTYSYQRCSSPCLRPEPARCQYDTLATRGRTSVDTFLRYDAA
ncbi:hypothetical protein H9L39_15466 [Fusarium oxysporum f. sp. albedinis]|nr:hypothetical protein H9L39_15466 [Fusarium oxysporum f. sp. albedinis]